MNSKLVPLKDDNSSANGTFDARTVNGTADQRYLDYIQESNGQKEQINQ